MNNLPEFIATRYVREIKISTRKNETPESVPKDLSEYDDIHAWILLGEPGSGKTTLFKELAKINNGKFVPIYDFIEADIDEDWREKILFLDGLDEARINDADKRSVIKEIRKQLNRLENPKFRISCRAADWFGISDRGPILEITSNQIIVLNLQPLYEKDLIKILETNHNEDPQEFIDHAKRNGIFEWLMNPQMLGLMVKAINENNQKWPQSKNEIFNLACLKLASENNKTYRDIERNSSANFQQLCEDAGYIFSLILLSNATGIALDSDKSNEQFIDARQYLINNPLKFNKRALSTMLFNLGEDEEQLIPAHRTIAEYLASQWLAKQIENESLSANRFLKLILGSDGATVSNLRGLYAWLAVHSKTIRSELIDKDALTLIVYGDVQSMSIKDKRQLLKSLKDEANRYAGFRREREEQSFINNYFGLLSDAELKNDLKEILDEKNYEHGFQSYLWCVLDIILYGKVDFKLDDELEKIIRNDNYWSAIRITSLKAFLKFPTESKKVKQLILLNEINNGKLIDRDYDLMAELLEFFYPNIISTKVVLDYIHSPKNPNYFGLYSNFWSSTLITGCPKQDLPILLDRFRTDDKNFQDFLGKHRFREIICDLIWRALKEIEFTDKQLFHWLGIGFDPWSRQTHHNESRQKIMDWLSEHPKRYKNIVSYCFNECKYQDSVRSCVDDNLKKCLGVSIPNDMGQWHLEQTSLTEKSSLQKLHLKKSLEYFLDQRGNYGLSLELYERWAEGNDNRKVLLSGFLTSKIPDWSWEEKKKDLAYVQAQQQNKTQRSKKISPFISQIKEGTAPPGVMNYLAEIWFKKYIDVVGESPQERIENFFENGYEIFLAAKKGFVQCLYRADLPSHIEILKFYSAKNQKKYLLQLPCLAGVEIYYQSNKDVDNLHTNILSTLIASYLVESYIKLESDWFTELVSQKVGLVAQVWVDYAQIIIKNFSDEPLKELELFKNKNFSEIVLPTILNAYPLRINLKRLHDLEFFLKTALVSNLQDFEGIVQKKLSKPSMDEAQKVYWLATATLLNPKKHEEKLWIFIEDSSAKAQHLTNFFVYSRYSLVDTSYKFSLKTIQRLIELLTPSAEFEWIEQNPSWGGNQAWDTGNQVRSLINNFSAATNVEEEKVEAGIVIEELLKKSFHDLSLKKIKHLLEKARFQYTTDLRESQFKFPNVEEIVKILTNRVPTSIKDLMAIALDAIEETAKHIRYGNTSTSIHFWNSGKRKLETDCCKLLIDLLEPKLKVFSIETTNEKYHHGDNRSDINLSYQAKYRLPIEVKWSCYKDYPKTVWNSISQLVEKYSIDPASYGYGIYLVLWSGTTSTPILDGGKQPKSALELQTRLEARLDPSQRDQIFIRVIDVTIPSKPSKEKAS